VSGIGDPTVVVQHLVGFLVGVVADEKSQESPAARRRAASAFPSYLEQREMQLSEGATAAEEVEVVGTCVYYYLPGPGHDARSRIGFTSVSSSEALFRLGAPGSGAVLDRTSGMGHCLECGGV
jgi:hypothetical protein